MTPLRDARGREEPPNLGTVMTTANILVGAAVLAYTGYTVGMLAWLYRPLRPYAPFGGQAQEETKVITFPGGPPGKDRTADWGGAEVTNSKPRLLTDETVNIDHFV
jgi:hypothetical protein